MRYTSHPEVLYLIGLEFRRTKADSLSAYDFICCFVDFDPPTKTRANVLKLPLFGRKGGDQYSSSCKLNDFASSLLAALKSLSVLSIMRIIID